VISSLLNRQFIDDIMIQPAITFCQAHGFLGSFRASSPLVGSSVYCLVNRGMCVNDFPRVMEWPEIKPAASGMLVQCYVLRYSSVME